jgi:hypothetical protein
MLSLRGLSSLRSLCLYDLYLDLSTLPLKLDTLQLSLLNQPTKFAYKKNIPVLTNLTFLELWDLSWDTKKLLEPLTNLETLTMATQRDNLRVLSLPPLPKLKKLNLADRIIRNNFRRVTDFHDFHGKSPSHRRKYPKFRKFAEIDMPLFFKIDLRVDKSEGAQYFPKSVSKVPIQWLSGLTNLTALQMPRVMCEPLQWEEWWLRKFFPNLKHFTATF